MSQTTMKRPSLLEHEPELAAPARAKSAPSRDKKETIKMVIAGAGILAACIVGFMSLTGGAPDIGELTRYRAVIDVETGEVFEKFDFANSEGGAPWANAAGKKTLYPAEACYWNKDGTARVKPTLVLLNQFKGVPGDTICPDCGRKVVRRNPTPPIELMAQAHEAEGK